MEIEVESRDVIRLMLQYCSENNLIRAGLVLQEETDTRMESVDFDSLNNHITSGKWDQVLKDLQSLQIPSSILLEVYEQIFLEMLEKGDRVTCQKLLNESTAFLLMRSADPLSNVRYKRLQNLLVDGGASSAAEIYQNRSRSERRRGIIESIKSTIPKTIPSRLLTLIKHGLEWERQNGQIPSDAAGLDLMTGRVRRFAGSELPLVTLKNVIKFPKGSFPEVVTFSADGKYLVAGSSDGLIEVYSVDTMKIAFDLEYQSREEFMVHDSSVTALAFNHDGRLLASADKNGEVRLWDFGSGKLSKSVRSCHRDSVTSLEWSKDDDMILTSSLDKTANVSSAKTGQLLEQYKDHDAFVSSASFMGTESIVTSSSDGYIRIFDRSTSRLVSKFSTGSALTPVRRLLLLGSSDASDRFLVCPHGDTGFVSSVEGAIRMAFESDRRGSDDFVAVTKSPMESYVYFGSERGNVCVFERNSGELVHSVDVGKSEITNMSYNPKKSMLAAASSDGHIYILGR